MIRRTVTWLEERAAAAEQAKTCIVAHNRNEENRLKSSVALGAMLEIFPRAYARCAYWNKLGGAERAWHKIRAFHELHPRWVFAGPTAAFVHGLSVGRKDLARLYIASNRREHRRSNDTWRSLIMSGDESVEVKGVRVSSMGRTLVDSLRLMDFGAGLAVADSALRVTGESRETLAHMMSEACPRVTGIKRCRAVLALADARAESGGESIARSRMLELGFALPELQRWYDDPIDAGERYRADFVWDVVGGAVIGELDGNEKYTNPEMTKGRSIARIIEDEHRRQTHIETRPEVLRIIRFGFADVMRDAGFLKLLLASGVPRYCGMDDRVVAAGGVLRCR